jgi:2'-5' RNA ligase
VPDAAPFPAYSLPGTHTLVADDRDPVSWRRGRQRFGVWVIDADVAPVRERLQRACAHLGEALWPSTRQPHITVAVGGFLCDEAVHADDWAPARLAAQQVALQALALRPFTLQIGRLDSFDSAAFLQVHDPEGGLTRLRQALVGSHHEYRDTPYCAHLTAGLYRRAVAKAALTKQLQALDGGPALRLPVTAVHWVSYAAHALGSVLRIELSHALG